MTEVTSPSSVCFVTIVFKSWLLTRISRTSCSGETESDEGLDKVGALITSSPFVLLVSDEEDAECAEPAPGRTTVGVIMITFGFGFAVVVLVEVVVEAVAQRALFSMDESVVELAKGFSVLPLNLGARFLMILVRRSPRLE